MNWGANFCMNGCESAPEIVQSEGINIFELGVNLGLRLPPSIEYGAFV